jgi:ABC-type transport system involved in multi-copper enzyme maturation permease subunit
VKPLVLKELREQFKVAVVALAVLTAMLLMYFASYGAKLYQGIRSMGTLNGDSLQPLMNSELLMQIAAFCALFGVLLGWLQIRAEKHPDLWAFLVHRPMPRTVILRSKVIAGLLLYAVAAGVPLLVWVLVLAMPGNVAAPFEWRMALPSVTVFFSGVVYYFAGLLTGLRRARWYASRGFGLGLAVLVSFAVFVLPEFWHALLIVAVATALLATAVWGSFQTGGFYRAQPAAGKVALTLTSAVAVMLLIGLGVGLIVNLLSSRDGYTYSQYQITRDGQVLKHTQRGFDDIEIIDLNGQPILNDKGQPANQRDMQSRYAVSQSAWMDLGGPGRNNNRARQEFFRATRFYSPWSVQDKVIWYLTADGRLIAYHGITRRLVATLAPADDARFLRPQNYGWNQLNAYERPRLLATAQAAYLADLEKRELKPIFTVPDGDTIGGYSEGSHLFSSTNHQTALVLTLRSVFLVDFKGDIKLQRPYVPSPPDYLNVSVSVLTNLAGFAVRFDPDYWANQKSGGKLLTHVDFVNPGGDVREALDLPRLPAPQSMARSERLILPLLPLAFPIYSFEEPFRVWSFLRIVPAILCVAFGWWLGRRHHFTAKAQAGWGFFHLIFGLPGLLAFLAVQEWPPKESCPKCKRLRAVDREQCEHCGAEFAPPVKTGTEIFEPLTTS